MDNQFMELIITVLSGLTVCIPLVVKLVEYVQKATKEKNWNNLLELVIELMETAETQFDNGADRKTWVLETVKTSAEFINYDIDINVVSKLIDSLCDMTKVVNPPVENG